MAIDARAALVRLQEAIDGGALDADLERLGVSVLSAFGSATRSGGEAADLDIGVRFSGPVRLLEIIDLLVATTGYDRIDVAVITGDHPVLDAEALFGIGLYEAERGAYANAQMAALGHRWDTAKFRDLDVGRFLREAGKRMATDGSDPQVEVVRRAYRLFGARRVDDLLAMMTDDVEWPDVANAAVLHGRDAIRPYWEAQFAQADPRVELIEVRESGDDLVAVVDQRVLGHDGQVLVPSTVVHHRYTFRGNLVRRMVVLTDPVSTSSSA